MILSKSNLQVVHVTKNDRIPVLNNVHIAEDGSTVGSNGQTVLLVGPVQETTKRSVPLDEVGVGESVTISEGTVKDILKNLPRDTQFKGLLEHCNVAVDQEDETKVNIQLTDGKRPHIITGKRWEKKYINYLDVFRRVNQTKHKARVILNLRRLSLLLETIEKACPDSLSTLPLFIEFSEEGDILIRTVNQSNGQRVLGVMSSYKDDGGKWLEPDDWERSIYADRSNSMDSNLALHRNHGGVPGSSNSHLAVSGRLVHRSKIPKEGSISNTANPLPKKIPKKNF